MRAREFHLQPLGYVAPNVFFYPRDRKGLVEQPRFFLTWAGEEHATLFYILWNNYHWGGDSEVFVIKCRNPQMNHICERAASRYILLEPNSIRPDAYNQWFMHWRGRAILQRGAPQRIANA